MREELRTVRGQLSEEVSRDSDDHDNAARRRLREYVRGEIWNGNESEPKRPVGKGGKRVSPFNEVILCGERQSLWQ
jgi:hypothetical protein